MKTKPKTLFISLGAIILMCFTSCEKAEMEDGKTGGGGKDINGNSIYVPQKPLPITDKNTSVTNDDI